MLASNIRRCFAAIVLGVLLTMPFAQSTASRVSAAGDCTVDATMDSEEQAFLTLINNHRAQNGLGPLTASYMLTKAAAWKSKDMATNNYFAHDDLSRNWVQRIRDCGYGFNTYLGENIAAGYTTAQQVFDGWKNSPGHNANMLGANYTTIGIGRYYVPGSTYGWYWTTDFGGFSDGWATINELASATVVPSPPELTPLSRDRPFRSSSVSTSTTQPGRSDRPRRIARIAWRWHTR